MEIKSSSSIIRNSLIMFLSIFTVLFIMLCINFFFLLFSFDKNYFITIQIITLIILIILVSFSFLSLKLGLFTPLTELKENIRELKKGSISNKVDYKNLNEINEIAAAFDEISRDLEKSNKKMQSQATEISDKQWELQDANIQLESSYGQLQAIIEQLNETEEKYHSLVRNIPEIVCVIENSGIISFVNHVCIDVLGYEKSEMIGKNLMSLVDTKTCPLTINSIISRLEGKNSFSFELHLIRNDNKVIITEATFTNYIYNGINMGLQAIIRDVTQKKEMEEEILRSNKEFSILNSVSKSIAATLDIDELSKLIVNEITDTLNCPACILGLADSSSTNLHTIAYSGQYFKDSDMVKTFENLSLNDRYLKKSIEKHQIYKAAEVSDKWNIANLADINENPLIDEFLFMPVKVKNKKIGILTVGSSTPVKKHDVHLISSIANSAAVAIDNALLYETSKKYFFKTIDALIAAVEAKDKYTEGHSQRVSKYAIAVAKKLELSKEQVEDIQIAGILHDIGKIGISDNILLKPEKLTFEEYEIIKQHPVISNKILYPAGFSDRTLKAIAFHHERYDGKGYPYGLSGNDITIEAKIIAVADAYDAMTSNRSYRLALSNDVALNELIANKSTQFSPEIVDAMVEIINSKM